MELMGQIWQISTSHLVRYTAAIGIRQINACAVNRWPIGGKCAGLPNQPD